MRLGPHLVMRTCVLPVVAVSACVAALTSDEARTLANASTWHHGLGSIPDSLRVCMAANRAATDLIEEVLLGRRQAPPEFNTAVALWWLADSGRPEYLPTLLHFAGDTNLDVASVAGYGLARHTGRERVRARLLEVYALATGMVRNNMVASLAIVNDSSARSLLAEIDRRDLQPYTIQRIEQALLAPAQPAGKGRWPSLHSKSEKCPE
jgi:hypothetical protein